MTDNQVEALVNAIFSSAAHLILSEAEEDLYNSDRKEKRIHLASKLLDFRDETVHTYLRS